ncbi:MAG: endonuclease Q family protein [Acidobacteriaceae bacterium]
MRVIADLHIHSKYSRACSQDLTPENIGLWADKKGISVIGSGDLTHPLWRSELKQALVEDKPGLYRLKSQAARAYFLLSVEISSIYKQGDKVRRIHNLLLVPNFEAAERLVRELESLGCNLKSDGRPITGLSCDRLAYVAEKADPQIVIVPAHVWTPHFGLFGSMSGFDSIEEAFKDHSGKIFALETGLSSDPAMNWQVSKNDRLSLISNSDAHSLRKIGREANVFEIAEDKLSFLEIIRIIKQRGRSEFLFTIEFFPEEGKYHLDGHADCSFSAQPKETDRLKGICPKCGKKLLVGVLNRVDQLGDREYGARPETAVPCKSIIPLEELIAETYSTGVGKKVLAMYDFMTSKKPEFEILLDLPREELEKISDEAIAESVIAVREGRVKIEGGYDGVFGKIEVLTKEGARQAKRVQADLF